MQDMNDATFAPVSLPSSPKTKDRVTASFDWVFNSSLPVCFLTASLIFSFFGKRAIPGRRAEDVALGVHLLVLSRIRYRGAGMPATFPTTFLRWSIQCWDRRDSAATAIAAVEEKAAESRHGGMKGGEGEPQ